MEERDNIPSILMKVKNPQLSEPPYRVPTHYFENLEKTLLDKIKEEEEIENELKTYPLLKSVSRAMPYAVPDGYFGKIKGQPDRRTTVIRLRRWWVAAAVITAFMIITAVFKFSRKHNELVAASSSDTAIQYVSVDELTSFIDADIDNMLNSEDISEGNTLFKNISNQELLNFLNETSTYDGILN